MEEGDLISNIIILTFKSIYFDVGNFRRLQKRQTSQFGLWVEKP